MKRMTRILSFTLAAVLAALTLSACGSGGQAAKKACDCAYCGPGCSCTTQDECGYAKYTPYVMTDSNGTEWKLFIEDNYDFILRGYKEADGHYYVKQVVGPTFNPVETEDGSITLGVAVATVFVDGQADDARSEKLNEGYQAFCEAYKAEHDVAMVHLATGINTSNMSLYDPEVDWETVLPGWGD